MGSRIRAVSWLCHDPLSARTTLFPHPCLSSSAQRPLDQMRFPYHNGSVSNAIWYRGSDIRWHAEVTCMHHLGRVSLAVNVPRTRRASVSAVEIEVKAISLPAGHCG